MLIPRHTNVDGEADYGHYGLQVMHAPSISVWEAGAPTKKELKNFAKAEGVLWGTSALSTFRTEGAVGEFSASGKVFWSGGQAARQAAEA